MRRCALILSLLCLVTASCSDEAEEGNWGKATLKIVNNSSRYVSGKIDAEKLYSFTLPASSNATYSIPVGSGLLNYTDVVIKADVHETAEAGSAVVWSDTEKIRMKPDHSYEYVIPFSGAADFHPVIIEHAPSKRSITAP